MQPARELPTYLTRTATSLHKAHARGPINHAGGRRRRYSRLVFKGAESERNFSFLPHTGRLGVKTRHAPFLPPPLYITSQWRRIRKRILHSSSTAAYTHTHVHATHTGCSEINAARVCSLGSLVRIFLRRSLSLAGTRSNRARASERASEGPPAENARTTAGSPRASTAAAKRERDKEREREGEEGARAEKDREQRNHFGGWRVREIRGLRVSVSWCF